MTKGEKMYENAKREAGGPYIFGTSGQVCTPGLRRKQMNVKTAYAEKIRDNCPVLSGKRVNCDGCRMKGKRAFDCRGLVLHAGKIAGLVFASAGATSQWKDKCWKEKGEIAEMPRDKVCVVFRKKGDKMEHVGVYGGDGNVVDCRGHRDGTRFGAVESYHRWTHYARHRDMDDMYDESGAEETDAQIARDTSAAQSEIATDAIAMTGTAEVVAEKGGTVNMRESPDRKSRIVVRVPVGEKVEMKRDARGWIEIEYGGRVGWMMTKFLMFEDESDAMPEMPEVPEMPG